MASAAMEDRDIDPEDLRPMHSVVPAKVAKIAASLREHGWEGRRLLVEETDWSLVAWTGMHRIAAAIQLGWKTVPCRVLTHAEADAALGPLGYNRHQFGSWRDTLTGEEGPSDQGRLRGLRKAGLDEAADMLELEISSDEW